MKDDKRRKKASSVREAPSYVEGEGGRGTVGLYCAEGEGGRGTIGLY